MAALVGLEVAGVMETTVVLLLTVPETGTSTSVAPPPVSATLPV